MKKNLKWLGLGGVLGFALLFTMNLPAAMTRNGAVDDIDVLVRSCMDNVKKDCTIWAREGGEAPRGLTGDARFELGMGERYILSGVIQIISGDPYLHVDFQKQPWLANRSRVKNPLYRINDAAATWAKYDGAEVTIVVTARYSSWVNSTGRSVIEIYLDPSSDSELRE